MRKAFSSAILIVLFITGCKKGEDGFEVAWLDTYWPVTKGSYWKYTNTSKNGQVEVSDISMTGVVTLVNGQNRYEYTVSNTLGNTPPNGQATGFVISENGLAIVSVQGSTGRLRLNENVPMGQPWVIFQYSDYLSTGKIVEKGLIRTVKGKKYRNVIHLQEMEQYNAGPIVLVSDTYMAKGIGVIESSSPDGLNTSVLTEYSIK